MYTLEGRRNRNALYHKNSTYDHVVYMFFETIRSLCRQILGEAGGFKPNALSRRMLMRANVHRIHTETLGPCTELSSGTPVLQSDLIRHERDRIRAEYAFERTLDVSRRANSIVVFVVVMPAHLFNVYIHL